MKTCKMCSSPGPQVRSEQISEKGLVSCCGLSMTSTVQQVCNFGFFLLRRPHCRLHYARFHVCGCANQLLLLYYAGRIYRPNHYSSDCYSGFVRLLLQVCDLLCSSHDFSVLARITPFRQNVLKPHNKHMIIYTHVCTW